MRSSPSPSPSPSGPGCLCRLLHGADVLRGGTALKLLRWGLPLLFLGMHCSGQEKSPAATVDRLVLRKWKVPADFIDQLSRAPLLGSAGAKAPDDPFASDGIGCAFYDNLPFIFEHQFGIPFPAGTTTGFSPNRGELVVKNTKARQEMIDKLITSLGTVEMFVLDEALFSPVGTLVLNGGPFPAGVGKQQWRVAPEVIDAVFAKSHFSEEVLPDPFAEDNTEPELKEKEPVRDWTIEELFLKNGLAIPPEGSVTYERTTGMLTSLNTEATTRYTEMLFLNAAVTIQKAKLQMGESAPVRGR